eukprot:12302374-Ditylum_brightwellii.AAC.1
MVMITLRTHQDMPSLIPLSTRIQNPYAGCGCPISCNTAWNSSPCWQLTYKPPTFASAAEPIMLWIVEYSFWIALFVGTLVALVMVDLLDK